MGNHFSTKFKMNLSYKIIIIMCLVSKYNFIESKLLDTIINNNYVS